MYKYLRVGQTWRKASIYRCTPAIYITMQPQIRYSSSYYIFSNICIIFPFECQWF